MRRAAVLAALVLTALPASAEAHGTAVPLDAEAIRQTLTDVRRGDASTITLPRPGGGEQRFTLRERPVLVPSLQARYPEIRTYAGRGLDDPSATVVVDHTPQGFHASVRAPRGSYLIDPKGTGYVATRAGDRHAGFREAEDVAPGPVGGLGLPRVDGPVVASRTYRLALLSDPSYAAYVGAGNVLAAKATLINRVTQIYEDDLGVRFALIDADLGLDTEAEMIDVDGPCGSQPCFTSGQAAQCTSSTLNRTKLVIGLLAGADTFDIGHLILGNAGGGVAGLGVAGRADKARGCTGRTVPAGNPFAIDYVAHELGHQFGANHTYNGALGSCTAQQWVAATAVEPGSGSTVMGYPGICDGDNLQPNSDPYFSQRSITEIGGFVGSAQNAETEVQATGFTDFFAGDSFTLTANGRTSAPIAFDENFRSVDMETAIASILPGSDPRVSTFEGLEGDPTPSGFRVTLGGGADVPLITVTNRVGFTAVTNTIVQGGPAANGGAVTATSNRAPVVTAPEDRTIPIRTPFALTGAATDADEDTLLYSWEQNDRGSQRWVGHDVKPDGPLFRVLNATASPTRTFPDAAQIAAGNTNAATGDCTINLACLSEYLPTEDYTGPLHFRLTARDLGGEAGGTGSDDVTLTPAKEAGPFRVTSQAAPADLIAGQDLAVTWDVAGTDTYGVDTADVRISLSEDGGLTFPHELAAATPNDGAATVTLPDVATTTARVKVEAVGNVFFDVSRADLTIERTGPQVAGGADTGAQYSDPLAPAVTITATDPDTPLADLVATADGLPAGITLADGTTGASSRTWRLDGAVTAAPSTSPVTVTVSDGTASDSTTFDVVVTAEDATVAYTGPPTTGSTAPTALTATVGQAADGSPGDLTRAAVTFAFTSPLCPTAFASTDGAAACSATLPAGDQTLAITVAGTFTGATTAPISVAGPTPTATATTQPTATAEPTAEPTTTAEPTATATAPPDPTPEPTAVRRPDLSAIPTRVTLPRTRRVALPIRCALATPGTPDGPCRGTATLLRKRTLLARTAFTLDGARRVVLIVPKRRYRALARSTKATVSVTVEGTAATRTVRLRKR